MNAFQEWSQKFTRQMLDRWPEGMPPELHSMSRAQAEESLALTVSMKDMPDAELTPPMVMLRDAQRAGLQKSYSAFVELGRTLLGMQAKLNEEEFWRLAEKNLPDRREDILLAMRAAREADE